MKFKHAENILGRGNVLVVDLDKDEQLKCGDKITFEVTGVEGFKDLLDNVKNPIGLILKEDGNNQLQWKSVDKRPTEDCTILIAIWYDYWRYDVVNYHKDGDYIIFFQGDRATMSWDDFMDVGYWWSEFNEPKLNI